MFEILVVLFLIVALCLIGLVLIQQGKGADMGASFGSGASNTVFGSSGSGNFLTKATAICATLFFVLSLALGNLSSRQGSQVDEWSDLTPTSTAVEVPADDTSKDNDVPQ